MKKGNVFLLGAGYLAGLLVALKFNKKSPKELEKELADSPEKYKTLGKNLMDIHKNLFDTVEESLFSAENKKRIAEYKERYMVELENFKRESEAKMKVWKKKGIAKKDEVEAELTKLYERRVELMEIAKKRGLELLEEAREGGLDVIEEGKKIANTVFDEAKKNLDEMHKDIKKKLKK